VDECRLLFNFMLPSEKVEKEKLEMWANAHRDGRLPNIGGALCSTPQFG